MRTRAIRVVSAYHCSIQTDDLQHGEFGSSDGRHQPTEKRLMGMCFVRGKACLSRKSREASDINVGYCVPLSFVRGANDSGHRVLQYEKSRKDVIPMIAEIVS